MTTRLSGDFQKTIPIAYHAKKDLVTQAQPNHVA